MPAYIAAYSPLILINPAEIPVPGRPESRADEGRKPQSEGSVRKRLP